MNEKQLAFLEVRRRAESDEEAARQVGVSASRVSHWKRESEEFAAAYRQVVEEAQWGAFAPGLEAAVRRQVEAKAGEIVGELMEVIRGEEKGQTKVAAIRLAFEICGLVGERRVSVTEVGPNLRRALTALGPVYREYLRGRADTVEGEYVTAEEGGNDDAGSDSGR